MYNHATTRFPKRELCPEMQNENQDPNLMIVEDALPNTPQKVNTPQKEEKPQWSFECPNWIKRNRIHINQKPLKLNQHPTTITLLAEFYKNPELTERIVALMVQDQYESLDIIAKKLVKQFFPSLPKPKEKEGEMKEWILKVGSRVNYGLTVENAPSALCLYRWEVEMEYLPEDVHQVMEEYRKKRVELRDKVAQFYDTLTEEQRKELCDPGMTSGKRKREEVVKTPKAKKEKVKELTEGEVEKKAKTPKTPKTPKVDTKQKSISGFFMPIKKKNVEVVEAKVDFDMYFRPFCVKPNVSLFSAVVKVVEVNDFDLQIETGIDDPKEYFMKWIKNCKPLPGRKLVPKAYRLTGLTTPWKLLQFAEDVRPPYFGTFTTKSKLVNGKKPFGKAQELDYEEDSEAEWEEDEVGEELMSEEDEEPEEVEEPEQEGWVVPHGYLSDDEGLDKDEVKPKGTELKKRVVSELTPILIGPTWDGDLFKDMKIQVLFDAALYVEPTKEKPKKKTFPVELLDKLGEVLIVNKFVNGKDVNLPKLVESSMEYLKTIDQDLMISKTMLENTIKSMSVKEKRGEDKKPVWYLKSPENAPIIEEVQPIVDVTMAEP